MKKKGSFERIAGFTLIEMCVAMVIAGFIVSGGLYLLKSTINVHEMMRSTITERDMQRLTDALEEYKAAEGHYPCPASLTSALGSAEFGKPVAADCASGSHAGTVLVTGAGGKPVRIGAVPIAVLGVSTQLAFDQWGNRLTYAASADPAKAGGIAIRNASGNSLIQPGGSAQFVVVSHGRTGHGAYSRTGVQKPCSDIAADKQNCTNNSHIFVVADYSESETAQYDDLVRFAAPKGGGGQMEIHQVEGSQMTGLTPGATYLGAVYGYGNSGAGIIIRDCEGNSINNSAIGGITGRATSESMIIPFVAPDSGCIRGYTHRGVAARSIVAFRVK
ncbi:MAG: prepilin-type N-terminal cleavage/methylation domain-containing protein [Micavibrio sp.]